MKCIVSLQAGLGCQLPFLNLDPCYYKEKIEIHKQESIENRVELPSIHSFITKKTTQCKSCLNMGKIYSLRLTTLTHLSNNGISTLYNDLLY